MQIILTEKEYQDLLNKQYTEVNPIKLANELAERCYRNPDCKLTTFETDLNFSFYDAELAKTTGYRYVVIVKRVEL